LLELLHKHRTRPLILLVAAAGFGKSTLAAAYARESGGVVVWLGLQDADRDSRRCFSRLADAFEGAFAESGWTVGALRRGLEEGSEGVGLARLLLTDLAQAPDGFILVLDDFHIVDGSEAVVTAVDALIRDLPEAGQIVITAREAPALSMTRLVVAGAVFPLGTEDLRFTREETVALRALRGGDATNDEHAEGWVAGILLGGAPRQLGVAGGWVLGTYVEREVLARLTPTEQNWLELFSVVDSVTPRVAEKLLGPGPWPARLLALTEHCPFFVAVQGGTYRLHGLVRDTVLNRLRRSPDDRAQHAWRVARELAEEAADPVALVRACQELGEIDGAVEVVRRTAAEGVRTGRWPAVLVTLELLPEEVRRAQPDLSLLEARALLNSGRSPEAKESAEAALMHGGRTADVRLQVSAIVELATVTFASDLTAAEDWLGAADHLLRTGDLPIEERRLLEGRAFGVRGICATLRGHVNEARECFENGERLLQLLGPSRDLALLQQNFGSFCNRTGDYARAQQVLASAASHWRIMGDSNGRAVSQIVLGDIHLRLGNLEAAGNELHDALEAARSVGSGRMEAHAMTSLGQWHRASGRIADAVAAFDEGIKLTEEILDRELLAQVLAWRAELALLQDDLPGARRLLSRAQAEGQRAGSNAALAAVDRSLGRLHLHDGAAARAVHHLEAALERGGDAWGPDERAETLYWLGTAYLTLSRIQRAHTCLERAIALAEEAKLPTLLAGPAAEDGRLLQAGRQRGLRPVLLAEMERLAEMRRPWMGVSVPPSRAPEPESELPRIEVQLFGAFAMHANGEPLGKASRKDRVRELAALLVLHPNGLPDVEIAELMFPEMPREGALHNLQMATYSLRKDLGAKATVRYGAKSYQLNPQLELVADVRDFDAALARARSTSGDARIAALTTALELYRGPLLADMAWLWLEPFRLEYRTRFVETALQLADLAAPLDPARSTALAERVLEVAPETDLAYVRLILNARQLQDEAGIRRLVRRYERAATLHDFRVNPAVIHGPGRGSR
jgi:LuxR family maltose regulon positive regulatory protein